MIFILLLTISYMYTHTQDEENFLTLKALNFFLDVRLVVFKN